MNPSLLIFNSPSNLFPLHFLELDIYMVWWLCQKSFISASSRLPLSRLRARRPNWIEQPSVEVWMSQVKVLTRPQV